MPTEDLLSESTIRLFGRVMRTSELIKHTLPAKGATMPDDESERRRLLPKTC